MSSSISEPSYEYSLKMEYSSFLDYLHKMHLNIDVDNIPTPSMTSSMEEIDGVLNFLLRKNNRFRYSSMAEEFISTGAEIIETVLDGNRKIPVLNISPDYTGYSSTVQVKLHRIRFETSQLVGEIVERHQISPFTRIMLELLPSLFFYPRIRSKQKSVNNSTSAFNNIRNRVDPHSSKDDDFETMKAI